MGFFDKIKDVFKTKETKRKIERKEKITEDITKKEKLPKKQKIEYKEIVKKLEAKYHHIIKIYFVRDNIDLDDDIIELMIKFVEKYKDRFIDKDKALNTNEPKLQQMFKDEFETELYIEIITLATNKKRLTIKELWKYAQEFLDNQAKNEGSANAILVGLTKIGLIKNELPY